jgi:hypothetical protein
MENKYTFDGDVLLKDGNTCVCPKNPGMLRPVSQTIMAHKNSSVNLSVQYLSCNHTCPFMRDATKKQEGMEDIKGVVLMCMEKQIFYEISIPEKKLNEITLDSVVK